MQEQIKYYTSSDGKQTPLKDMEYTHLSNSLAKKYREIFDSMDEEDFNERLNVINDIKEEMYSRINRFHDEKFKKDVR